MEHILDGNTAPDLSSDVETRVSSPSQLVDELVYNERHSELMFVKYLF